MSNSQPTMLFIPVHWLEMAAWHRGLVVYAREVRDLEWAFPAIAKPQNCKGPISPGIRPAA